VNFWSLVIAPWYCRKPASIVMTERDSKRAAMAVDPVENNGSEVVMGEEFCYYSNNKS
jgi:hypothetical protein